MNESFLWLVIAAVALGTFLLRAIPIALISRIDIPHWVQQTLRYVPPAVMTAIITPALFIETAGATGSLLPSPDTPRCIAAFCAALVAWRTRSTLLTLVVGMNTLWGAQYLLQRFL